MNTVLATEGPLDVEATLSRYRLWGEDPTNCVADGVFRRVLRRDTALVPYEVRWSGTVEDVRLAIRIPGTTSAAVSGAVTAEVRSLFGLDFGALVGGAALLTEVVFGLNGVGKLTYDSLQNLDLPVIMATVLYATFFVVLVNALVDLVYAWLDPRVRLA